MDLIEVKVLNTTIERTINRELRSLNITSAQADVLMYLYRHSDQELYQKDLDHALSLSHPTMSSILKLLEQKGLICCTVSQEDRRFKQIHLTEKSQALIADLMAQVATIYEKAIAGFTPGEVTALSDMLRRMGNNLK